MTRYIFIGLFTIIAGSCIFKTNNIPVEENQIEAQPVNYLALGDSYTIGESVDSTERWPVVLADKLKNIGLDVEEVKIIARTGWTTDELIAGIAQDNINKTFGLVTLLIGVNNQFRGRDTADYRVQFKILMDGSLKFAGNNPDRVIVVSIPDYGVTPFGNSYGKERIANEIDRFNLINLQESRNAGVHYVDITGISRRAETDELLIAADNLHPSAQMYRLWVEEIFPLAKEILTSNKKK